MRVAKPPDWLIYAALVAALLFLAIGHRQPASVPVVADDGAVLAAASPFDPSVAVDAAPRAEPAAGTAFSVSPVGVWVTARHVVDGCLQAAVVVAPGRGVEARVRIDPRGEAAVLLTDGGGPALPLAPLGPLRRGARAYHPGYPQGEPGEAASRLIGRENLVVRGRGARTEPVLVWAEAGRSQGLTGTLGGLSGAPALDELGRVIAVTIAEAPRRGRIYTTVPETVARAMAATAPPLPAGVGGPRLTPQTYHRVADDLRRTLQVAQVVCLRT